MNETQSASEIERSPVHKALRLLERIARSDVPLALPELSRGLGLPKPTTFRLARLLEQAGYVSQDPLTRRYTLGAGFDELALNALRNGPAQHRRQELMNRLAARLGARINLVLLKSGKLSFVEWVNSSSPLRIDLQPGVPVPVHCSASGKLLMAFAPESVRARFLADAPFPALTPATLCTRAALQKEFEEIRSRGYAEDCEEFMTGVNCLSVPIRNPARQVVAGLAVMAPQATFPIERCREHRGEIQACADAIAAEMADFATSGRRR